MRVKERERERGGREGERVPLKAIRRARVIAGPAFFCHMVFWCSLKRKENRKQIQKINKIIQ